MSRLPFALPYLVHTNRELGLMLRGEKPLAKFIDYEGHYPDVMVRYFRMFDRHVSAGTFTRRDKIVEHKSARLHHIYFALPNEEWRIDAMFELMTRPGPWSREREREEGELLGYTDEQNAVWLAYRHGD